MSNFSGHVAANFLLFMKADAFIFSSINNVLSVVILALTVIWSLFQTFNHNPPNHFIRVWGQLFLKWLAYSMPWWALVVVASYLTGGLTLWIALILLILIFLYFYSTCIVPNQLKVHEYEVNDFSVTNTDSVPEALTLSDHKLAVVSNLRLGLFSQPKHIHKLVNKINQLDVDYVLIIGEWLYNPSADLVGGLMQLRVIKMPIYAIQGAHDNRYIPDNADQFLHEDDLNHAFNSLGIQEVNCHVKTNSGLSLIAKPHNKDKCPEGIAQDDFSNPRVLLCNSIQQLDYCLSYLEKINSRSSNLKNNLQNFCTLVLSPSDSKVIKKKTNEFNQNQTDEIIDNTVIKKLPSFGQRGLPFRFKKPSISVLNIKMD